MIYFIGIFKGFEHQLTTIALSWLSEIFSYSLGCKSFSKRSTYFQIWKTFFQKRPTDPDCSADGMIQACLKGDDNSVR